MILNKGKRIFPDLKNEDVILFASGKSRYESELSAQGVRVWRVSEPEFILEKIYQNSLLSREHAKHVFIFEEGSLSNLHVEFIKEIKRNSLFDHVVILAIAEPENLPKVDRTLFDDVFLSSISSFELEKSIQFHHALKNRIHYNTTQDIIEKEKKESESKPIKKNVYRLFKRLFDITFSCVALLLLSPIFVVLIILIPLESRGPIFYVSKRAGRGYKVFNFYKFRSMYADADARLLELSKKQNLYSEEGKATAFIKLENDPRITTIGKFIRATSIDELPQFLNVLKGDMSLVGNRPLPLYEAKELTVRGYSERYIAPAGITGLWQINKCKNTDMTQDERIALDNEYAKHCNFWLDMQIIYKTPKNMIQNEPI